VVAASFFSAVASASSLIAAPASVVVLVEVLGIAVVVPFEVVRLVLEGSVVVVVIRRVREFAVVVAPSSTATLASLAGRAVVEAC
jgi:hypothetical protein